MQRHDNDNTTQCSISRYGSMEVKVGTEVLRIVYPARPQLEYRIEIKSTKKEEDDGEGKEEEEERAVAKYYPHLHLAMR